MRPEKALKLVAGIVFLAISQLPLNAADAEGTQTGRFQKGTQELGLGAGYGFEISENVQTFSLLPRWGYFLTGTRGRGLLRGALEGIVEPMVGVHTTPSNAAEIGATLRLAYHFVVSGPFIPFVDVGLGALYEDLRGKNLGSRFLFNSGGGVGVEHFLGPEKSVWVGYRFRHVSNAGTASSNAGLSSNFVVIGVSFFRRPGMK